MLFSFFLFDPRLYWYTYLEMQGNLKVGHLNVRSVFTGFNELKRLVSLCDLDVLALSETWLSADHFSNAFNIPNYIMVRKDRMGRGGGIAFYVNSKYKHEIIDITCDQSTIEQLWIKIRFSTRTVAFAVFYRPPKTNIGVALEQLDEVLSFVFPTVDYVVCLGDINVNLLNLNNPVAECFDSYGFRQVISEPTRETEHSATLLDPIFVSDPNIVGKAGVVDAEGVSDHKLTFCEIKLKVCKFQPKIIQYRDFKYFNFVSFRRELSLLPWMDVVYEPDINKKVALFSSMILNLFNAHAPVRTARVTRPKAPWLTEGIRHAMKERDLAMSRFKSTRAPEDHARYKMLRNSTLALVRRAKSAHVDAVASENNSRTTWKALADLNVKQEKRNYIPEHLVDVEKINEYFCSVFSRKDCSELVNFYNEKTPLQGETFNFALVTVDDVNRALFSIKSDAFGCDSISLRMLKYCSPFIDPFIAHLVNVCLENGFFPDSWKLSIVRPIPKTAAPEAHSDLRPISLLPVLSKILERVAYTQISDYVNTKNILPQNQSGFRKGFSTAAVLSGVLDDIVSDLDSGRVSLLLLLDFSKAFDTINHTLMCAKLRYYGFSDCSLSFVRTYLSGRTQRVVVGDSFSSIAPVNSGVPQGSILGPLLFIMYTADILEKIADCSYSAYADDTQLRYSFYPQEYHVAEYVVNGEANMIHELSEQHGLQLNPGKSAVIVFGGARAREIGRVLALEIGGCRVPVVESAKSLGVVLDSQLKFIDHLNSLIKKAFLSLKILYSNRFFLSKKLRTILAESQVLSHFNYCSFVYGSFLNLREQKKIQRVQNSCVRFIFGLRKFDHISHLYSELRWLDMRTRRKLHFAVFTQKIVTTSVPRYLKTKLTTRSTIHSRITRYRGQLAIPRHTTALFRRGFSYQAAHTYNTLPGHLKIISNLQHFKKKYKKMLGHF